MFGCCRYNPVVENVLSMRKVKFLDSMNKCPTHPGQEKKMLFFNFIPLENHWRAWSRGKTQWKLHFMCLFWLLRWGLGGMKNSTIMDPGKWLYVYNYKSKIQAAHRRMGMKFRKSGYIWIMQNLRNHNIHFYGWWKDLRKEKYQKLFPAFWFAWVGWRYLSQSLETWETDWFTWEDMSAVARCWVWSPF